jgi:hypothetical protein
MSMRTKLRDLIIFGVAVAGLIAALRVMNWLPSAVQDGMMKQYGSFLEVRRQLRLQDVYVPTYYPEYLRWPPTLIAAQSRPFTAVLIEFAQKEKDDVCLVISQTAFPHSVPNDKIKISNVKEMVQYSFKGREAMLVVGVCKDDEPCSRISWEESEYRISLSMKSTPIELIKIMESMVH